MTARSERCSQVRASPDGRRLIDEDGSPFYWLGDSGWALFARLDLSESAFYLSDRKAKGFNIIQTSTQRSGCPPTVPVTPHSWTRE